MDRNILWVADIIVQERVALREEGVDRNAANAIYTRLKDNVALREEGVDRNRIPAITSP